MFDSSSPKRCPLRPFEWMQKEMTTVSRELEWEIEHSPTIPASILMPRSKAAKNCSPSNISTMSDGSGPRYRSWSFFRTGSTCQGWKQHEWHGRWGIFAKPVSTRAMPMTSLMQSKGRKRFFKELKQKKNSQHCPKNTTYCREISCSESCGSFCFISKLSEIPKQIHDKM